MAIARRRSSASPLMAAPSQRFSPFKEIGSSGVAVFGGRPMTREKGPLVFGLQRYTTYSDMVANISIVAAGVRYFLNVITSAKWKCVPADDSAEAKQVGEFIEEVIDDMNTPMRRIIRRSSGYRFYGFGIQEWTAKRRDDGKIGMDDIEARPQHTIEQWEVDERGTVLGVYQRSPQTGAITFLPRQKVIYLVEDSLTDSPEGMGLYRHLVEPYTRLQKYLLLEGRGFERDLRGIPIGRVPYQAIKSSVKAGVISETEGKRIVQAIEDFVKIQSKQEDTSIVLDSAPYVVETEGGKSISGVMQYGLELLQGQSADFPSLNVAVSRLNQEMARIIGVEHLLLGGEGGANRALSEDKSRNFYLTANGSLDDISDGMDNDLVQRICDLNGIQDDMRPELQHSDISFRSIMEITAALRDLASAGAVLRPDDPAVNDVRDLLGIERQPDMSGDQIAELMGKPTSEDKKREDAQNQATADAAAAALEAKTKTNGKGPGAATEQK